MPLDPTSKLARADLWRTLHTHRVLTYFDLFRLMHMPVYLDTGPVGSTTSQLSHCSHAVLMKLSWNVPACPQPYSQKVPTVGDTAYYLRRMPHAVQTKEDPVPMTSQPVM